MPLDGKRSRACSKRTSPRVAGGSAAVSKEPGRERQVSQCKGQTQTFDAGKVQSVSSKLWSCHLSKLSPIGTLEADGRAPIGAHARIPVPPTELLQSAPPSWDPTFPVVASWRHPAPLPANFCPAHTKTNLDFFSLSSSAQRHDDHLGTTSHHDRVQEGDSPHRAGHRMFWTSPAKVPEDARSRRQAIAARSSVDCRGCKMLTRSFTGSQQGPRKIAFCLTSWRISALASSFRGCIEAYPRMMDSG